MLELIRCRDPLTETMYEKLQQDIGFRIPKDYGQFLARFNGGGIAGDDLVSVPIAEIQESVRLNVNVFLHFDPTYQNSANDILKVYTRLRRSLFIPSHLLPIADVVDGYIFLCLREFDFGSVHTYLPEESRPWSEKDPGAVKLANSFTEFLNSLNISCLAVSPEDDELVKAVKEGRTSEVKSFVEGGADVNQNDSEGRTLLHHAVQRPSMLELLLSLEADASLRDASDSTPLHDSFLDRVYESTKLLLQSRVHDLQDTQDFEEVKNLASSLDWDDLPRWFRNCLSEFGLS